MPSNTPGLIKKNLRRYIELYKRQGATQHMYGVQRAANQMLINKDLGPVKVFLYKEIPDQYFDQLDTLKKMAIYYGDAFAQRPKSRRSIEYNRELNNIKRKILVDMGLI